MSKPMSRTIYLTVEVTVTGDEMVFTSSSTNDASECTVFDDDGDSYTLEEAGVNDDWFYKIDDELCARLATTNPQGEQQ